MSRAPRAWRLAAGLLLVLASGPNARAQLCPRVPAGLRCAPLSDDGPARREALQALDAEGRRRVGRGDLAGAAQAFGCLVEGDPTPESAGNLAVVLREQGELGDALLVARCAEELAPPGPARERARLRREELERRLGLRSPPPSDPTGPGAPANVTSRPVSSASSASSSALDLRSPAAPAAARSYRGWSYAALGIGAAALIGGGVSYALARDRARQFGDEQQRNGYSDRARSLRDDAQRLEIAGWVGAGLGVAAAAVGGVLLLTF